MPASNDSMKKITVYEDEIVVINGRKMRMKPDGTLEPVNKKRAFENARNRINDKMESDNALSQYLVQQKQND